MSLVNSLSGPSASLPYLLNSLLSVDHRDRKYKGLHGPDQVGLWGAVRHVPPLRSNATRRECGPRNANTDFSREASYVDLYKDSSTHEVVSQTQTDPQHTYLVIPGSD